MYAMGKRRHRRMRGGGIGDWLRKAHDFIKKNKLISRAGSALGNLHPGFARAGQVAKVLGYGRRRRHMGGALGLAGGALRLAGARRRGRHGRFVR